MKTLNSWEEAKALIVEQRKQEGAIAKELCEQYPKLGYSRALELAENTARLEAQNRELSAKMDAVELRVLCPIDNVVIEFDRGVPMNAKVCYFCDNLICDPCVIHVSGDLNLCKPCYEDVQRQRNGEFPL